MWNFNMPKIDTNTENKQNTNENWTNSVKSFEFILNQSPDMCIQFNQKCISLLYSQMGEKVAFKWYHWFKNMSIWNIIHVHDKIDQIFIWFCFCFCFYMP